VVVVHLGLFVCAEAPGVPIAHGDAMPELHMAHPHRGAVQFPRPLALPLPASFLLTAVIGLAFLLMGGLAPVTRMPPASLGLFWVGLLVITESGLMRLPRGGFATVTLAVDGAAIVLFGPLATAWMNLMAGLVTHGLVRRQVASRVAFHIATHMLATLAAGAGYLVLGGTLGSLQLPADLLAFVALGAIYFATRTGLWSIFLALIYESHPWRIWQVNCRWSLLHLVALIPLAAQAVLAHLHWGWWTAAVVLLPLTIVYRAGWLHTSRREERAGFATALVELLGEIDPYTKEHSLRVARYSELLARALGLPELEVERVRLGGLLHDVGKIGQAHTVLAKPTRLSEFERLCMEAHPGVGAEILARIPAFNQVADIIRNHHERLDGRGYPDGRGGAAIPLGARVVLVADAFDAMTSERPYHPVVPVPQALAELERCQGRQVDARVVATLRDLLECEALVVPAAREGTTLRRVG